MNDLLFILTYISVAFLVGHFSAWMFYRNLWGRPLNTAKKEYSLLDAELRKLINLHNEEKKTLETNCTELSIQVELKKNEAENLLVNSRLQQEKIEKLEEKLALNNASEKKESSKNIGQIIAENKQLQKEKTGLISQIHDLKAQLTDYDYVMNMHNNVMNMQSPTVLFTDASEEEKDDLQKINGIGPLIEKKLNIIGIWTYRQISELDVETIQKVTVALAYYPNRIKKDDWVGQAKRLIQGLHASELVFKTKANS